MHIPGFQGDKDREKKRFSVIYTTNKWNEVAGLNFGGDWGFFWERNDMTQAKHNGDLITHEACSRAQLLLIEMITEMCFREIYLAVNCRKWVGVHPDKR